MQKHPQWNQDTEQEISELESLFQASLQASQTSRSVLGQVDSSWRPLGKTGKTAASYLQLRLLKPPGRTGTLERESHTQLVLL